MTAPVLAVIATKGGVGRTTTAFQLGAELARQGMRVLAVDSDKQANLTSYTGGTPEPWRGLDAVFRHPPASLDPRPYIRPSRPGFDVLGTHAKLEEVDEKIHEALDEGPYLLRQALDFVEGAYDLVIVDVGHSPQIITNVVTVADVLVMPTPSQFPDADHVAATIDAAMSRREKLRLPRLDLLQRSVISIWRRHAQANADRQVIDLLRQRYGDLVAPTILPECSVVSVANQAGLTLREFRDEYGTRKDKTLQAIVDAYADLADFIVRHLDSVMVPA
jgi:cellulose biosynthesis protein BcsQ